MFESTGLIPTAETARKSITLLNIPHQTSTSLGTQPPPVFLSTGAVV